MPFPALSPYPVARARDKPISEIIKRGSAQADSFFIANFCFLERTGDITSAPHRRGCGTTDGEAALSTPWKRAGIFTPGYQAGIGHLIEIRKKIDR
jgi:hypothetical protein